MRKPKPSAQGIKNHKCQGLGEAPSLSWLGCSSKRLGRVWHRGGATRQLQGTLAKWELTVDEGMAGRGLQQ